jgi:Sulfotransferase family
VYPIGFFKDPSEAPPRYVQDGVSVSDLRAILGHFSYGLHRYMSTPGTCVTLLRDPVERVVSLYYHLVASGRWRVDVSLETFVQECPTEGWMLELRRWHPLPPPFSEQEVREASRTIVDNDQRRRMAGVEPGFGECDGNTLQQALENLKHFAVVGLVERFDESLLMMIRQFGWNPKLKYLPRLINRSKPAAIPSSVRELIQQRNALDFELYRQARAMFENALTNQGPPSEHNSRNSARQTGCIVPPTKT